METFVCDTFHSSVNIATRSITSAPISLRLTSDLNTFHSRAKKMFRLKISSSQTLCTRATNKRTNKHSKRHATTTDKSTIWKRCNAMPQWTPFIHQWYWCYLHARRMIDTLYKLSTKYGLSLQYMTKCIHRWLKDTTSSMQALYYYAQVSQQYSYKATCDPGLQ